MRVVQIVAGAGAMYCGACTRDAALARTLAQRGHEVTAWPIYTPVRLDEALGVPQAPLAFGGINAYLREKASWAGRLPKWARAWLDSPNLLSFASRFAVHTQAADLGEMTVSVLQGLDGKHAEAIRELALAVAEEEPDVVILPNTLLASLIPALREAGVIRIVCQVQGEDGFFNELPDEWRARAMDLVRRLVADADLIIAPCRDHVESMRSQLDLPHSRFAVVPPAIEHPVGKIERPHLPVTRGQVPRIGCLSSVRHAKGQDLLVAALAHMARQVSITFAGRVLEPAFQKRLRADSVGYRGVQFLGELSPREKLGFLAHSDVVCIPSRLRESRGYVGLEALVHGRPIVAPRQGIYAEFASHTDAVHLFLPDDPADLARALNEALDSSAEEFSQHIAAVYSPQRAACAFWAALERMNDDTGHAASMQEILASDV